MSGEEVLSFDKHDTTVREMYDALELKAGDHSYSILIGDDNITRNITRNDIKILSWSNRTLKEGFGQGEEITLNFVQHEITRIEEDVIEKIKGGIVREIGDILSDVDEDKHDRIKQSKCVALAIIRKGLQSDILKGFDFDPEEQAELVSESMYQIGCTIQTIQKYSADSAETGQATLDISGSIPDIIYLYLQDMKINHYLDVLKDHRLTDDQLKDFILQGFEASKDVTPGSSPSATPRYANPLNPVAPAVDPFGGQERW